MNMVPTGESPLDLLCITTLRTLAIDAVEQARSGHPGTPMGAAPIAYAVWQRFLRFDPADASWPDRDRFVLSAGHASALLYGLLHLTGVKAQGAGGEPGTLAVPMADLQRFRQLGSRCTGHPEHGHTTGVETTTGPLGQGAATSVGMALAQRWLAATYNRPNLPLFTHRVYALCSDGDLMEGLSAEAASLAGHLRLGNLCWLYDSNHISIEGSTTLTFTEDIATRFEACGWQVLHVADANDLGALTDRLSTFVATTDRPTLVIAHSVIGYGAPHRQDSAAAHGEPLGADEVRLTKQFYGVDPDAKFDVPDGVVEHFNAHFGDRGHHAHAEWEARFAVYRQLYPALATQIDQMQQRGLPDGWDRALPSFPADARGLSTREASGQVLNAIAAAVPWLIGGAADLAPSTRTHLTQETQGGASDFQSPGCGGDYRGRNLHFGVREHAMCAIANGLALSGLRPFTASFFIFSDYARGALRLTAMMELPVVHVWTHDSIALGEDGPTHQPVEQLASLRAMPGTLVLRPADAGEVVEAWRVAMQHTGGPVSLVLSRQSLPTVDRQILGSASGVARGGYVLAATADGSPDVLLIATGSEVALCLAAREQLAPEGVRARVVSLPSWELFERQDTDYRDRVLPPSVTARVSVEAGSPLGWERYTGRHGAILALRSFGQSAPGPVVQAHFGFDVAHVIAAARAQCLQPPPQRSTPPQGTP